MNNIKKISIIILTSVVVSGIVYLGLHKFYQVIYNQRTCEWANIDNIELHTSIDIPDIISCDCEYKREKNTKIVRLEIDENAVDLNRFIQMNKFKKVQSAADLSPKLLLIDSMDNNLIASSDLYYTNSSFEGENWQAVLNANTGILSIRIQYRY